jgi:hypothetical protein
MSQITQLASAQLTATDTITIELVEADETPAVVIVRWPAKPTVFHPRRFPSGADTAAASSLPPWSNWRNSDGRGGYELAPCRAARLV